MSKLRNRIRDIGRGSSGAMGFPIHRMDDTGRRQVLVLAEVADDAQARAAIDAGADVLVAAGVDAVAAAGAAADRRPAGVRLESATREDVTAATEAGADFVVFRDDATQAAALLDPELGRVLLLDGDRSEERLRSLAGLGLDAVVVEGVGASITVREQTSLRRVGELAGAPVVVALAGPADATAMQVWRDAGAPLVLVSAADASAVRAAVEAASQVPAPRRRRDERTPLVPAVSGDDVEHRHD